MTRATDLINEDIEQTKKIISGELPLPEGLKGTGGEGPVGVDIDEFETFNPDKVKTLTETPVCQVPLFSNNY